MATWEEHWAEGNTPWDAGKPAPALVRLARELTQSEEGLLGAQALVPGCGAGYDVFCLAKAGFAATGLDIAPSARSRFASARAESSVAEGTGPGEARLLTADFFRASARELGGSYDFIWDYTFYCAVDLEMRPAWSQRMLELLKPEGTLATLLYPVDAERPRDQGPPFALDPEQVTVALAPEWERIRLERVLDSHPQRENREWLALWKPRVR